MFIFRRTQDLGKYLAQTKGSIGFIPTMGALHQGHLALIETARAKNDVVVCSIFVNPTQFNDPRDFQLYPVTLETDIDLLEAAGTDILFLPEVSEMYPDETIAEHYDLGYLDTILEAAFRPGHYNGVCTIVQRLLEAVKPDHLYLGQKDYQQCLVIGKLIELKGLPVDLIICETLREQGGLAMSSRNTRLSAEGRQKACALYAALQTLCAGSRHGIFEELRQQCLLQLTLEGFEIEYLELAEAETLKLCKAYHPGQQQIILIAARLESVRLIDNMLLPAISESADLR